MATLLPGVIAKSGTPEGVLSRYPQYENLGPCTVYKKGNTTPMVIDQETVNQWSGYKMGNILKLRLRYNRNAGGTQIQGGTDNQYVIQLPSIVNIDGKRVTVGTDAITAYYSGSAVIGKGLAMSANGPTCSNAYAILYDIDARLFRLVVKRVDDTGDTWMFQSYAGDGSLGWAHNSSGGTTLSFQIDFDIPVTD